MPQLTNMAFIGIAVVFRPVVPQEDFNVPNVDDEKGEMVLNNGIEWITMNYGQRQAIEDWYKMCLIWKIWKGRTHLGY